MNNVYSPIEAVRKTFLLGTFFAFTHKYLRLGSKKGKQEEVITEGDDSES